VEARILRRAYPPGYRPKRDTHLMQPMSWMGAHIDDITAYLAAVTKIAAPTYEQNSTTIPGK
jgi:hypothetical protein